MDENNNQENLNKTPRKMSRLAWPKAIYGVVLAVIIIIVINSLKFLKFIDRAECLS